MICSKGKVSPAIWLMNGFDANEGNQKATLYLLHCGAEDCLTCDLKVDLY